MHKYTDEQRGFIIEHKDLKHREIANLFSKQFGVSISKGCVSSLLYREGQTHRRDIINNFSQEQLDFIRDNFLEMKGSEFVRIFNEKFDSNISIHTIRRFANKKLGLKKKRGSFNEESNYGDITEHPCRGRKRYFVKTHYDGRRRKQISLEKYIYEQYHGTGTDGKYIIHLDGNCENFDIENLYLLNQKEMATVQRILGGQLLIERDKDITLSAIQLAKLMIKLKECNG